MIPSACKKDGNCSATLFASTAISDDNNSPSQLQQLSGAPEAGVSATVCTHTAEGKQSGERCDHCESASSSQISTEYSNTTKSTEVLSKSGEMADESNEVPNVRTSKVAGVQVHPVCRGVCRCRSSTCRGCTDGSTTVRGASGGSTLLETDNSVAASASQDIGVTNSLMSCNAGNVPIVDLKLGEQKTTVGSHSVAMDNESNDLEDRASMRTLKPNNCTTSNDVASRSTSGPSNSNNSQTDSNPRHLPEAASSGSSKFTSNNTSSSTTASGSSERVPTPSPSSVPNDSSMNSEETPSETQDASNNTSNESRIPEEINDNGNEAHNNTPGVGGFAVRRNTIRTQTNNLNDVRERMFHTLFTRFAIAYGRATTPILRRFLEFFLLLKCLSCLSLLIMVHVYLRNYSPTCLSPDTVWDKSGILRVEIINSPRPDYDITASYMKEEMILRGFSMLDNNNYAQLVSLISSGELYKKENEVNASNTDSSVYVSEDDVYSAHTEGDLDSETIDIEGILNDTFGNFTLPSISTFFTDLLRLFIRSVNSFPNGNSEVSSNFSDNPISIDSIIESNPSKNLFVSSKLSANSNCPNVNSLLGYGARVCYAYQEMESSDEDDDDGDGSYTLNIEDTFIMEYSLDYGLLRLSSSTRKRFNVPVTLLVLNPDSDACFGGSFAGFVLANLVGYDDMLLTAVQQLAEKDGSRGYLRNAVTGEHYRFVSMWLGGTNYVGALVVMALFTLSVSLLLRYSHHQIFLFIIHVLENNAQVLSTFPAAPMLTVILALVGMEAIMSEFFKDTTTAFYVIVIVWLCDQYEALCCSQPITRKHWIRFFYLYHFAFYAYHYRCNGQYSWLALSTSWFFTQHSMVYFFHHYELPAILRIRPEVRAFNIVMRQNINSGLDRTRPDQRTPMALIPTSATITTTNMGHAHHAPHIVNATFNRRDGRINFTIPTVFPVNVSATTTTVNSTTTTATPTTASSTTSNATTQESQGPRPSTSSSSSAGLVS